MDWNDSHEQANFRTEVKEFIDGNLPQRYQRDELGFPSEASWVEDRRSADDTESGPALSLIHI